MTRVIVALPQPHADRVVRLLGDEAITVLAVTSPAELAEACDGGARGPADASLARSIADSDAVIAFADRRQLTSAVAATCDAHGIRLVAMSDDADEIRFAGELGLSTTLPCDAAGWQIAEAVASSVPEAPLTQITPSSAESAARPRVIVVWGPAGSPGRSTLAVELAVELARGRRRVALVDADTHAPSVALALGLADEGPGFAAACRAAERGELDAAELTRISSPLPVADGAVDVLAGINRPARWPELSGRRVRGALEVCRDWADDVVVDVSASLERDEELMSDLAGPQRNAATLAALRCADAVVAVVSADPVGVSRFVRAHAELRAVIGATPVHVVANRLRPGALGIDARGQLRRTLDRFAGVDDLDFLPDDPRAADAAVLSARPIADAAGRSPIVQGIRRFVGARLPSPAAYDDSSRRRGARRQARRTA